VVRIICRRHELDVRTHRVAGDPAQALTRKQ
jgi:hypothetical protein